MRQKKLIVNIKVMCDYCTDGLWWNGGATTVESLPRRVHFLKDRIRVWQDTYESFHFYRLSTKECIRLNNTAKMKSFIREGKLIALELKKKLPPKYRILYFNEGSSRLRKV